MSALDSQPIGKRYTLEILAWLVEEDQMRYGDLRDRVGVGSDATYSQRLQELQDAGLIERESFDEIPPRVEYRITEAGASCSHHLQRAHELCAGGSENGTKG